MPAYSNTYLNPVRKQPGVRNITQGGQLGSFMRGATPEFLQRSPLGQMQMGLLQGLFGDQGVNRQFLRQDLANIGAQAQQQARNIRGQQRFRGSGVGAALESAALGRGTAMQSRRMAQAEQEELARALALSNAVTSGFTQPLMQGMGLGSQNWGTQAQIDAANRGGGFFDQLMGAAIPMLGAAGAAGGFGPLFGLGMGAVNEATDDK